MVLYDGLQLSITLQKLDMNGCTAYAFFSIVACSQLHSSLVIWVIEDSGEFYVIYITF